MFWVSVLTAFSASADAFFSPSTIFCAPPSDAVAENAFDHESPDCLPALSAADVAPDESSFAKFLSEGSTSS